MRISFVIAALATTLAVQLHATASTRVVEKPAAIIADGAPAIPLALADSTRPYMESRTAFFQDWNPIDPFDADYDALREHRTSASGEIAGRCAHAAELRSRSHHFRIMGAREG